MYICMYIYIYISIHIYISIYIYRYIYIQINLQNMHHLHNTTNCNITPGKLPTFPFSPSMQGLGTNS